jgi:DNA modification methylase
VTQYDHPRFTAYHADTVEVARSLPDESVDFSIFSPPFASLYTYSNSERDMGNVKNDAEFFTHVGFLVTEQFRVMAPGRLVSIHCMLLPTTKEKDGYIGLRDFRGDLIRMYQKAGFIFHSEVVIWKDPVTAMQRTKALGLLHKQVKKDSCMSRQGIPDYLVTMRKPGVNAKPVTHTDQDFPVSRWQRYASPVWMDIDPSNTLQYRSARTHDDERHICPLQLQVIERAIELWSRPDDTVWSPFMGIASEGVISLREGRRFLGAELKQSYYEQAVKNLIEAATHRQTDLFDGGTHEPAPASTHEPTGAPTDAPITDAPTAVSTHEPASTHEPDPVTIDDAP